MRMKEKSTETNTANRPSLSELVLRVRVVPLAYRVVRRFQASAAGDLQVGGGLELTWYEMVGEHGKCIGYALITIPQTRGCKWGVMIKQYSDKGGRCLTCMISCKTIEERGQVVKF